MLRVTRWLALFGIYLAIAAGITGLAGPAANAAPAQGIVSLSGMHLLRDGREWVPKGLEITAWDAPAGYERRATYARAKQEFGPQEFAAMRAFGADLIRVVVSQQAIDPEADGEPPPGWTAAKRNEYLSRIIRAVRELRAYGFSVLLQMNDNRLSRLVPYRGSGIPDAATVRAWQVLAPVFADDRGVMYGTYNEPYIKRNNPDGWNIWQAAEQPVINAIRAAGARNVIVVEGIAASRQLANRFGSAAGRLSDPDHALLYGVHPYFDYRYRRPENTPSMWYANWGAFAETHPVIADEWVVSPYLQSGCAASAPRDTTAFFEYLSRLKIGLVAWAWDVGSGIQVNNPRPTYPPTLRTYAGFSCSPPPLGGPGQMLHAYYTTRTIMSY